MADHGPVTPARRGDVFRLYAEMYALRLALEAVESVEAVETGPDATQVLSGVTGGRRTSAG